MQWYERYGPQACLAAIIIGIFAAWLLMDSGQVYSDAPATVAAPEINLTPVLEEEFVDTKVEKCETREACGRFESHGERICRETLENHYGVPFKNVRPSWLKNPETKRNLELDCYNEELGIAVEYNGVQHYEWPNFTRQTREEFLGQVRRDNFKVMRCNKMGVYLVSVPFHVKHAKIPEFLLSRLPKEHDTAVCNGA